MHIQCIVTFMYVDKNKLLQKYKILTYTFVKQQE